MEVIKNYKLQNNKTGRYDENFKNVIEELTEQDFIKGIEQFKPIRVIKKKIKSDDTYLTFKYNDMDYKVYDNNNKCLCGHDIKNILICSCNGKLYKIGVSCIKKFYEYLNKEQIEYIEHLEKLTDDFLKSLRRELKDEHKITMEDYNKLLEKENDDYDYIIKSFYEGLKDIKKKEDDFLTKERKYKDKKLSFQYLINNTHLEENRNILLFYYNKYPYITDNQKKFLRFKINQKKK